MKQHPLFDRSGNPTKRFYTERPPFQAHSETSEDAADAIKPSAGSLRGRVLAWLKEHGPATDEEMQDALDMNPSTQRPRRVELRQQMLVHDTGNKRETRSGRAATLWDANEP